MTAFCQVSDCRDREGNPWPSARGVCEYCQVRVERALAEIPSRFEATEDILGGRPGRGARVSVRASREVGISLDQRVFDARLDARQALARFVGLVAAAERLEPCGSGSVRGLCSWLRTHVDALLGAEFGPAAADSLITSWRDLGRVIDIPAPRQYLGPCEILVDGAPCGADVLAVEGAAEGGCVRCGARYPTDERRMVLEAATRDHLGTVREVADLASRLLETPVSEDVIRQWASRGRGGARLVAHSSDRMGRPLFRIGDVYDLAGRLVAQEESRRKGERAS